MDSVTIEHCLWQMDYVQLNTVCDWWIQYNWTLLVTDRFCTIEHFSDRWILYNWTLLVTDGFCRIEHC